MNYKLSSNNHVTKPRKLDLKIAVYGLGHVGASVAAVWLRAGAHVIGVDKSQRVLESAKLGRTHIPEPGVSDAYTKGLRDRRFEVYSDPLKASQDSIYKVICVPVLAADGSADLAAVQEVAVAIGKGLKKGDIIALNPSVPPGTTEEVVIPLIEKASHLQVEKDFFMIYNPERIYEGRAIQDIEERYPAIVSGAGPKSLEIGSKLCAMIYKKGVIKMSSIRTAETEKLLEGVYRDVNIALANELARFCERIGVNFWEAREAANSQPFCHIHKAGAGVGGACIPVYPQFILHTANKMDVECNITRLGRKINNSMPAYCVKQALSLLNGKKEKPTVVTILGLAFRGDVADARLSPTYKIIEELENFNVKQIIVHDPFIVVDPNLHAKRKTKIILTSDLNRAIKGSELIILATDHSEYASLSGKDFNGIPVYDGRAVLNRSDFTTGPFAAIGTPLIS